MENLATISVESPVPTIDANTTMNSSGSPNSNNTKPQRVLGFLRKKSSPSHEGLGGRASSSSTDLMSPTNSTSSSDSSAGTSHQIKNMIRRKSVELGRIIDGSAGASAGPNKVNNSRASLDQESFQDKKLAHPPMHERGVSNMELTRPASPFHPNTASSPTPPTTQGRRATFSLGLPWRPTSEYTEASAGLRLDLSKAQRRFIRIFPELADLVLVPSAYCAPCLSTPPLTPPVSSSYTSNNTLSPSTTLNTVSSSEFSSSSNSTTPSRVTSRSVLSCPGHFDDFSCALERDILWHGTLFVSATHICFYGKQFGKIVKVIIDYRDLVSIEKEKKMGVFPSSIRVRTKQAGISSPSKKDEEQQQPPSEDEPILKDYVLTSFISREQAYSIMERNWNIHRQHFQNLSNTGLETPQTELSDLEGQSTDIFSLDLESRIRGGSLREKRRSGPRTYSVVTDELFSSTENVDRQTLHVKKSSSRLTPSALAIDQHSEALWGTGRDDIAHRKEQSPTTSSSSSESRRGSVASSSSNEKQENGLIGFVQKRRSTQFKQHKGTVNNQSESQLDGSIGQQEVITQPSDAIYPSPPVSSPLSVSMELNHSSGSILSANDSELSRSCTPPPTLISPSLTTTKVSHSSSTVQSLTRDGSREMSVHAKKTSTEAINEKANNINTENIGADNSGQNQKETLAIASGPISVSVPVPAPAPVPVLPSGPITCECSRHYKNHVITAVIPLPLELVFEILYAAKGAGEGSKVTWDAHRIRDGSTELKVTPWQYEDSKDSCDNEWENLQRNLEYSVTFKMPMLSKASTSCFETQQITLHRDHIILVHSETRTPNVPYGEHFSTVNQICMTWEAPGKTKIRCHTEVKFKKSILWSSKVENGSLEGSGGFYKEFIKQLQELCASQGEQLLVQFNSSQGSKKTTELNSIRSNASSTVSETRQAIKANAGAKTPAVSAQILSPESGRAQTMLSQQIQRSSVNQTSTRLSLDGKLPSIELTSPSTASPSGAPSTPTLTTEKKSGLTTFLTPWFSTGGNETASTDAAAPAAWGDYFRKGLTYFVWGSEPSNSSGLHHGGASSDSISSLSSQSGMSEESSSYSRSTDTNRVKFALPSSKKSSRSNGTSPSVRSFSSVPSLRDQRHQHSQQQQQQQQQQQNIMSPLAEQLHPEYHHSGVIFLSKAFFIFVILGMIVTALNIWHLHNVVSSIVDVVHQRQDPYINYPAQHQYYHHQHQQFYHPTKQQHYHHHDQHETHFQYVPYAPRRYERAFSRYSQFFHRPQMKKTENFSDRDNESPSSTYTPGEQTVESDQFDTPSSSFSHQTKANLLLQVTRDELKELQGQKEKLEAEITELMSKLELAQKNLEQVISSSEA